MKYKKFRTLNNEELSVIGYGSWPIGGTWNNSNDSKSIETIRTALDLGINFFPFLSDFFQIFQRYLF